jgi:hypothetical protein
MPIDDAIAGPMLGPFRGMLKEVDDKGLRGEHVDAMRAAFGKMEGYARSMSDIMAFTTRLGTEGLFMAFSNAYGKALTAQASQAQAQPTDDAGLLRQTLTAYEDALRTLQATPNQAHLVPRRGAGALGLELPRLPARLRRGAVDGAHGGRRPAPHAGVRAALRRGDGRPRARRAGPREARSLRRAVPSPPRRRR